MTRSPWHIQLVGEILAGIFIIVLIAFPTKIEIRVEQALYFLVEDCQKTLAAGWNGVLLVVCQLFLNGDSAHLLILTCEAISPYLQQVSSSVISRTPQTLP